jgi:hypothetical protein
MTQDQIDYIESETFIEGHECLKLGVPWVTKESIYELEKLLNKDDIVLEVGTGGSTIFFSERCYEVTAIETSGEWAESVRNKLQDSDIYNVLYMHSPDEKDICDYIGVMFTNDVTVFSVDTQGGYNRSKILNAFLQKGISASLRMIVLDNYSHEGLFPDSHSWEGWEVHDFNHPRWAGSGTRICIKK